MMLKVRAGNFQSDPSGDHIYICCIGNNFNRCVVSVGRVSANRRSHAERIAIVRAIHYLLPHE